MEVICGDSRDVLDELNLLGVQFDSCVTDPPYGLTSITERFGKAGRAEAVAGADGSFRRLGRNFMAKEWDATGIEGDPAFWSQVLNVLKPGGFCLAFSSARTGDIQASAMRKAGFVIHPMIAWLYAQGMPKQHPVDKAMIRAGMPEKAEEWSGWGYGAAAMSPALEPIYVAQRPYSERTGALNILKHGVGAINLDGCRTEDGRFPSNVVTDGSEAVDAHLMGKVSFFYHAKATKEDRGDASHPTVKPIQLMRWLCRLVTPRGGTVLDPFAGSGTTGVAALREGFNPTLIEADPDYQEHLIRRMADEEACLI